HPSEAPRSVSVRRRLSPRYWTLKWSSAPGYARYRSPNADGRLSGSASARASSRRQGLLLHRLCPPRERLLLKALAGDNSRSLPASCLVSAYILAQSHPPTAPACSTCWRYPTLKRAKELADEIPHHTAEHALADSCELAAHLGFVAVLETGASLRFWLQPHQTRSRAEAQWSDCLAEEPKRASFALVAQFDLRVIRAANRTNANRDPS